MNEWLMSMNDKNNSLNLSFWVQMQLAYKYYINLCYFLFDCIQCRSDPDTSIDQQWGRQPGKQLEWDIWKIKFPKSLKLALSQKGLKRLGGNPSLLRIQLKGGNPNENCKESWWNGNVAGWLLQRQKQSLLEKLKTACYERVPVRRRRKSRDFSPLSLR